MKGKPLNDDDRAEWIDNDEGLYDWWKSSRQSKRQFIRTNRAEIDAAITSVVEGDKPAHHLKYTVVKLSELGPDLNLSAEHHIAKAEERGNMSINQLEQYGQELVAAGFEVWLTKTGSTGRGYQYLQYRDPETGCTGSLQESFTEGWQHLMPLVPSQKHGSSMYIANPLPPFTVEAARQCAQPFNWNDVVGRRANARDRQWRSDSAIALHAPKTEVPTDPTSGSASDTEGKA